MGNVIHRSLLLLLLLLLLLTVIGAAMDNFCSNLVAHLDGRSIWGLCDVPAALQTEAIFLFDIVNSPPKLSICSSKTGECSTVENKQICRPRRVIHQEQQHAKTLVRLHTFYSYFQHTPFIQSSSWPTALLPVQQLARRRLLWADDFFGALGKSVKTKVELGQTKHPKPSGYFGGSPFKKGKH